MLDTDALIRLLDQVREGAQVHTGGPDDSPPLVAGDERTVGSIMVAAQQVASVDQVPQHARARRVKKGMLAAGRIFVRRQAEFNRLLLEAVGELNHQLYVLRTQVGHDRQALAAALAGVDTELARLTRLVTGLEGSNLPDRVRTLETTANAATSGLEAVRTALVRYGDQLARTRRALAAVQSWVDRADRGGLPRPSGDAAVVPPATDDRVRDLYASFEDAFRQPTAVREQLSAYLDDVWTEDRTAPVFDVGCGTGIWLGLLAERGIPAYGMDLDAQSVERARADGLDARTGDAIGHLQDVAPASLAAVTAFHVIEHLTPAGLLDLIDGAARALRPGGVLIMETPNTSNLTVGSSSFWRDPTHVRPMHPDFVAYACRERGFGETEVRFLHPRPEYEAVLPALEGSLGAALETQLDDIRWALYGPQDVAIVARLPR